MLALRHFSGDCDDQLGAADDLDNWLTLLQLTHSKADLLNRDFTTLDKNNFRKLFVCENC